MVRISKVDCQFFGTVTLFCGLLIMAATYSPSTSAKANPGEISGGEYEHLLDIMKDDNECSKKIIPEVKKRWKRGNRINQSEYRNIKNILSDCKERIEQRKAKKELEKFLMNPNTTP